MTGKFQHESQKVLLHVQSCTIWEINFRTNSIKFKFFNKFEPKTLSRAVKLSSTDPEEVLEEKNWNYKKTVSILNDKLLDFEQILFVRVAKTAWYESIGSFSENYLQETMSQYFSFLQFWSNKFSVWCWNCILRVQRKSLIFLGIFVDTSRILSNSFWERMPEQDFMLSVIPFARKDKKLQI